MAIEIERKFLVLDDTWRSHSFKATRYRQGYLANSDKCSVRVRVGGGEARLTVKGVTVGVGRAEFEYPLPVADAEEMLGTLCLQPLIEKTRYLVRHAEHLWEVDVFSGENLGLTIAEIELRGECEGFERPAWLGEEVSHDPRYYNLALVRYPFRNWKD